MNFNKLKPYINYQLFVGYTFSVIIFNDNFPFSEDEIERMLAEGNIESNGEINYEMFVKLITSE
jgi:Ca2+-binding EF-hand superfamily protein